MPVPVPNDFCSRGFNSKNTLAETAPSRSLPSSTTVTARSESLLTLPSMVPNRRRFQTWTDRGDAGEPAAGAAEDAGAGAVGAAGDGDAGAEGNGAEGNGGAGAAGNGGAGAAARIAVARAGTALRCQTMKAVLSVKLRTIVRVMAMPWRLNARRESSGADGLAGMPAVYEAVANL